LLLFDPNSKSVLSRDISLPLASRLISSWVSRSYSGNSGFSQRARNQSGERHFRETWTAIRSTIGSRTLWIVGGFIFILQF